MSISSSFYETLTVDQLKVLCRRKNLKVGGQKDKLVYRLNLFEKNVDELKVLCRKNNLKVGGRKRELIGRLSKCIEESKQIIAENPKKISSEIKKESTENQNKSPSKSKNRPRKIKKKFVIKKNISPIVIIKNKNKTPPKIKIKRKALTEFEKKKCAANQKFKCAGSFCGKTLDETYEIDHIIPVSLGGPNISESLQAMCPNCHSTKTKKETTILKFMRQQMFDEL